MTPLLLFLALLQASPWRELAGGVAMRDLRTSGHAVFVGMGGWSVQDAWARAWVDALADAALRDRGVRWAFAVRGPRDTAYRARELGTAALAAQLDSLAPGSTIIVVAAHSSGSFVAHVLLKELQPATRAKTVYVNLDGGEEGFDAPLAAELRGAWFVFAGDSVTGGSSANAGTMRSLGTRYAARGGARRVEAAGSGCAPRAPWCLHDVLITERPSDPAAFDLARDYTRFGADRRVQTAWLDVVPR